MIPLHPDWQHRNQWCLLGSQGAYRLWKDDFALTQDVGKSCKKRKHNIQEAFIYHGYNVTTLPFFWVGGGGDYRGTIYACISVHGVHACFGSCSLDAFLVETKVIVPLLGVFEHCLTFAQ